MLSSVKPSPDEHVTAKEPRRSKWGVDRPLPDWRAPEKSTETIGSTFYAGIRLC